MGLMPPKSGDLCPQCHMGHIYPSGLTMTRNTPVPHDKPSGKFREFKCDKCGHIVRGVEVFDYGKGEDGSP